jgi:hypothetical protein
MNDNHKAKQSYDFEYNIDPISGEHGAHPIGVGLGAGGGATIGAVAGAAAGPVGAALGAAVGGVVGGLAGKGVGEWVNPTAEDEYWAIVHADQPFARSDLRLDDYLPAYRTGYLGAARYVRERKQFDEVEPLLAAEYARTKGNSALVWEQAKQPARAAWDRIAGISPHSPR